MKLPISPIIWVSLGVNVLSLALVSSAVVAKRLNSDSAIEDRAKGLVLVAQHFKADTCWKSKTSTPFKLGDEINIEGSETGQIPTSCILSIKTGQVLQVAYSNDRLVVAQIYSKTELRNQLSIFKKEASNEKQN